MSGDICPKFQSRSGSPHLHASSPVCNVILGFTSRRPAWQSSHSHRRTCKQASVGLETRIYRVRLFNVLFGQWIATILLITAPSLIFTVRKEVGVRLCFYRCLWFCSQRGWYPSIHCRWYLSMPCSRSPGGGEEWYPSMLAGGIPACLGSGGSPGAHPRGVSRPTTGGVSRPTPGGCLQAHTQGVSRPTGMHSCLKNLFSRKLHCDSRSVTFCMRCHAFRKKYPYV